MNIHVYVYIFFLSVQVPGSYIFLVGTRGEKLLSEDAMAHRLNETMSELQGLQQGIMEAVDGELLELQ